MSKENRKPFGRPTVYNDETLDKCLAYIELWTDPEIVDTHKVNGKDENIYKTTPSIVPSVAGLAVHMMIHRSTIYEWKYRKDDFSDILEYLMAVQNGILVNGGLSGSLNSTITKLMLTKHGLSDKQDLTIGADSTVHFNLDFGEKLNERATEAIDKLDAKD